MLTNILTFPQWEKISVGVEQPTASHQQEGIGERQEDV
jgi:hypothetical protein